MPHSVLVVTLQGFVKLLFTTCYIYRSFVAFWVILCYYLGFLKVNVMEIYLNE